MINMEYMVEVFLMKYQTVGKTRKVLHSIEEILTKENWLKEKVGLKLPNGLPSYDTIRRTVGMIDPKVFQRLFINWIEEKLDRSGDVSKRNMQENSH